MTRRLFSLVSILALVACSALLSSNNLPDYDDWSPGAPYHEIQPTPWHRQVWQETAECVRQTKQLTGSIYNNIRWYTVEADAYFNGGNAVATWVPRNRIFIVQRLERDRATVAHESIHAMLHEFNHPNDPFGRCVLHFSPNSNP